MLLFSSILTLLARVGSAIQALTDAIKRPFVRCWMRKHHLTRISKEIASKCTNADEANALAIQLIASAQGEA